MLLRTPVVCSECLVSSPDLARSPSVLLLCTPGGKRGDPSSWLPAILMEKPEIVPAFDRADPWMLGSGEQTADRSCFISFLFLCP